MVDESPSDQGLVHPRGEILLYVAPDGQVTLDVSLMSDSVWLSQTQMAELTRHMATAQGLGLRPAHNPRKARMTKY